MKISVKSGSAAVWDGYEIFGSYQYTFFVEQVNPCFFQPCVILGSIL